ncbi:hypothetical protein ACJIZ3_008215 [Penstemon smallii]|uniref:Uncharacterized protein n=1 Tax=Penstemon smallii TaxID=265156 RepID=A0ABD3T962_9LAMI
MYSPGGPASMFAIGPYAYETQLVSPPVFSTFTTEPSTAPYTPPTESYLNTPSSPEVPFARLLEPNLQNREASRRYPISQYEFQSSQFQPGSPGSHLISPCSGTSSPYPYEFTRHPFFLEYKNGNPPKPLDVDKDALSEWDSRQGSGVVTPDATGPRSSHNGVLNRQYSDVSPLPDTRNRLRNDDAVVLDHRVSFEVTAEEIIRCVEKKPVAWPKILPESVENVEHTGEEKSMQTEKLKDYPTGETSIYATENALAEGENEHKRQKNRSITLGSAKEFNFDNIDGGNSDEPSIGSDWWANEKVLGEEVGPSKNWSFFPMVHTEVS